MKQPVPGRRQVERVFPPSRDLARLPPRVADMRTQILQAVESGDIENLRPAIERNETIPIFGRGEEQPRRFADAIDVLKRRAFDGKGQEVLAILHAIFEQPYVAVARANSMTYVWPAYIYGPVLPEDPDVLMALMRCVRFSVATTDAEPLAKMDRIGIGADGTWHFFWQG